MKLKQLLLMISSFWIITACSSPSVIESENVIVTDHINEERYAVRLDEDGNLIQEDIEEEVETDNKN